MREWTINIEAAPDHANEAVAESVLERLAPYSPAVSFGNGRLGVTMTVMADTPGQAVDVAAKAFMGAVAAPADHLEIDIAA